MNWWFLGFIIYLILVVNYCAAAPSKNNEPTIPRVVIPAFFQSKVFFVAEFVSTNDELIFSRGLFNNGVGVTSSASVYLIAKPLAI